jgi:hypothetical protein
VATSLLGSVGVLTFVMVLRRVEPFGAFGCAGRPACLHPVADHGRQCGDGLAVPLRGSSARRPARSASDAPHDDLAGGDHVLTSARRRPARRRRPPMVGAWRSSYPQLYNARSGLSRTRCAIRRAVARYRPAVEGCGR